MRKKLKVYLPSPIGAEEKHIEKYSLILKTLRKLKYEILTSSVDEVDLKLIQGKSSRKPKLVVEKF